MNAVIDAGAPLLLIVVSLAYAKRVGTLAARGRPVTSGARSPSAPGSSCC